MKQSVLVYLQQLFTEIKPYQLTNDEQKKVQHNKTAFLIEKITRKKFRKHTLTPETLKSVSMKVNSSVVHGKPIHFVIPFGGYKHFWNVSHPEPDWAELFNFRYLTEFVAPILTVYEPGVIIEYMSEDMILNRMNNYPFSALEKYSKVFSELISWYSKLLPENLQFRFFRVGDRVDKKALIAEVEKLLPEKRKDFDQLSAKAKDQELHRSKRSIFWKGEEDWSHLTETEKQNKIIESRLIELTYYDTEARPEFLGEYLSNDDHICLLFSFGTTHDNDTFQDLTIGSSSGSVVDHWIGRGIIVKHSDSFIPTIISRNQYAEIKEKLEIVHTTDFLHYKNYQQIEVQTED